MNNKLLGINRKESLMNTLGMNYFVERLCATKYISFWNGFDSVVFFGYFVLF